MENEGSFSLSWSLYSCPQAYVAKVRRQGLLQLLEPPLEQPIQRQPQNRESFKGKVNSFSPDDIYIHVYSELIQFSFSFVVEHVGFRIRQTPSFPKTEEPELDKAGRKCLLSNGA